MKNFKLKPYMYGGQPDNKNSVKLNTNENIFPPSVKFIKNLINEIKYFGNILKFYPDPNSYELKIEISNFYNIYINQIFIGNGSDEILGHIFYIIKNSNKKLYIYDITYSFYESYIKLYKINYSIIELDKNYKIKFKYYKGNSVIITNPNAPTGISIDILKLKNILHYNKNSIIIIDEAYIDFGNNSSVELLKFYKNIIIVKTLSKSRSGAAVRMGLALSNSYYILILDKIKNSFNSYPLDSISQLISSNLYKDFSYFEKIKSKIIDNKYFLIKLLNKIYFEILNSRSNFLLIKNKYINNNKLIYFLNKKNIFIRKFEIPKIENYLRISIGSKLDSYKLYKNIIYYIKYCF